MKHKRDDNYWLNAAWRRLQVHDKKRNDKSICDRGLVSTLIPFGTNDLLKVENIDNKVDFLKWANDIYPTYRLNYKLLNSYIENKNSNERNRLISESKSDPLINPEVLSAISIHLKGSN